MIIILHGLTAQEIDSILSKYPVDRTKQTLDGDVYLYSEDGLLLEVIYHAYQGTATLYPRTNAAHIGILLGMLGGCSGA